MMCTPPRVIPPPKYFCGSNPWTIKNPDGVLSDCFTTMALTNIPDYIAPIGCIVWYILVLKKYHNFNAALNRKQPKGAQIAIFFKFLASFLIAFSWIFTRLNPDAVTFYPNYMIFSDSIHLFCWFCVVTLTYLEWNRSLPHGLFLRLFWLISAAVSCVKLYLFIEANRGSGHYFKRLAGYATLVVLNCALALIGLLGFIPSFRRKFEPRQDLQQSKTGESAQQSQGMSATKLFWKHTVTKESIPWLIIGSLLSIFRGYLLQEIYRYFGNVFSATSENNPADCGGPAADNTAGIVSSIVKLVIIFSVYAVLFGVAQFFWSVASEIIVNGPKGIRNRLFKNMLAQESAYIHTTSTGTLVSRFANDADRVKRTISEFLPQVLEFTAMVIAGLIFLFTVSWSISIYLITIVPLTYAVSYYQAEILELYESRNMARIAAVTSKVQDVFSKFTTVLIYGKQNTEKTTLRQLIRLSYVLMRRKAGFSAIIVTVTEFLSWSTTVLGTFLGASLIITGAPSGENPLGRFVTYCLFSINVIKGVVILLKTLPKIGETLGACSEILLMIEREPQLPECGPHGGQLRDLNVTAGQIEFKNVVFSYPASGEEAPNLALDGVNLVVKPNSKVAIVGDSGAGKSTILHLIARFYDPTSGSVMVDGQDLRNYNVDSLRRHMAIVSQDSDIFAMTILENILYGRSLPGPDGGVQLIADTLQALKDGTPLPAASSNILAEAMKAVEGANATDFVEGSETKELGEDGKGLSGGQKQRLTISRALFKNPKILLLDEVTSALDAISEGVVQAAIDNLTADRTVLIVAHRLHTIKNSDKIIVMQKGHIVAAGTHDELMVISERYRQLVEAAEKGENLKPMRESQEPEELSAEIIAMFKNVKRALRSFPALRKKYLKRMVQLYPQLKRPRIIAPAATAYGNASDSEDGIPLSRVGGFSDTSSEHGNSDSESLESYESDHTPLHRPTVEVGTSIGGYYLLGVEEDEMEDRISNMNKRKR